jgi:TRAP-type C4-dicarboxylate transport system substrate-binding protein
MPASETARPELRRLCASTPQEEYAMSSRYRTCSLIAVLSLTVLASAGGSTVLAQDEQPVTLRLALAAGTLFDVPSEAFVTAAHDLSGGAVTIVPTRDAGGDGGERLALQMLADGQFDLAMAPTRAWEGVGVTRPEALLVPYLIDNDPLSIAVATSPIATELLAGMTDQGFAGLAIWPEGLRHPTAFDPCAGPILTPSDVGGMRMRDNGEAVAQDLLTSMGATLSVGDPGDPSCPLQGSDFPLNGVWALDVQATLTADVTPFPKYSVLAANASAFERLPARWQQVLRDAATAAQGAAIGAYQTDVDAAKAWCQAGFSIVLAGQDAVSEFKAAARPVIDKLSADPDLAPTIQAIEALKATIAPSPDAAACDGLARPAPASFAPATAPTPIDGTWVISTTLEDMLAEPGLKGSVPEDNYGDATVTFDAGQLTIAFKNLKGAGTTQGTYRVDGDMLIWHEPDACCPNEPFYFYWRIDGDTLTLSQVPDRASPWGWVVKPFTRLHD